ncbi:MULTISPECIES: recombinase family protein [unclassified Gordonia (in: high G+C Gram-positive bacteria)]|uniref:recombinase family protein n=1 Tax=Gordonia TaxID=2053 RepID=UPI00096A93AC|nr:recombinase family protein [Gordonia sp. SCSIO 19800]
MTTTTSRRPVGRPPLCSPSTAQAIADWHARGYSDQQIADRLNHAGVPTPSGGTDWTRQHVWRLLGTVHVRKYARPAGSEM